MARRDVVLVVDDALPTLRLLVDTLEEAGFTVLAAADGVSALLVAGRVTPDAVLMDAVMPELDGFETCRRLRRRPDCAAVPVIFMTGLSETESVLRGFEAGGVDYVTKPVSPHEIVARVNVHIANARLTRSAHAALDAAGRTLLAVDQAGRLLWATPQAARLLGDEGAAALQAVVGPWLPGVPGGQPGGPVEVAGAAGPVELTLVGPIGPEEVLLRLSEAAPVGEAAALRQRLGVTAREAEVLLWLARGKQNRDIAHILGLSPRTVDKHLEQIYAKLDVENRVSAAAIAMRALR